MTGVSNPGSTLLIYLEHWIQTWAASSMTVRLKENGPKLKLPAPVRVAQTMEAAARLSRVASFCQWRSSFVSSLISATRAFLLAWSYST